VRRHHQNLTIRPDDFRQQAARSRRISAEFPSEKHLLEPLWFALKSRLLRQFSFSQSGTDAVKVACPTVIWVTSSETGERSFGTTIPRFGRIFPEFREASEEGNAAAKRAMQPANGALREAV
jgi:hypothetical protein